VDSKLSKGSKFCLCTKQDGLSKFSCANDALFTEKKKNCPNLTEADGCYECANAPTTCVCSKDGCNAPPAPSVPETPSDSDLDRFKRGALDDVMAMADNKTVNSDSKIVALVPVITVMIAFILGIF
jgi:hypothetical protein